MLATNCFNTLPLTPLLQLCKLRCTTDPSHYSSAQLTLDQLQSSGGPTTMPWRNTRCGGGQLQGVCLYPLTLEKQTALRMVLEDLVINAGFAYDIIIVQVRCHSLSWRKSLSLPFRLPFPHLHQAFRSAVFACQWNRLWTLMRNLCFAAPSSLHVET